MTAPATNRTLTGLISVLLFAGAFLATGALLRGSAPRVTLLETDRQLEFFASHVEEYDTVFLGSSRVLRGFLPQAFDERSRELGRQRRSYNMGVGGLTGFEADYVLEELLSIPNLDLELLFIEPLVFDPRIQERNVSTLRSINWHTPGRTWHAIEASLELEEPLTDRLKLARTHLDLGINRMCSYGTAGFVISSLLAASADSTQQAKTGRESGYREQELEPLPALRMKREYSEQVLKMRAKNRKGAPIDGRSIRLTQGQVDAAERRGITLSYVMLPTYFPEPMLSSMNRDGHFPNCIPFNRPRQYAELYAKEVRFDIDHLNRLGAERLSRLLAERIERETE